MAGANGDKVSHFVMNEVQTTVEDLLGKGQSPKQALTTAFEEADSSLAKNKAIDAELSGTTAVVLLYHFESPTSHKMWAACAGDSRAVFSSNGGKKVTDATVDQKPDTPAEQRRIEQAGARSPRVAAAQRMDSRGPAETDSFSRTWVLSTSVERTSASPLDGRDGR